MVAKQRINHLQKDEWTDKVFTGDNCDATAHFSQLAGERDLAKGQSKKGRAAQMVPVKTSLRDRLAPMRESQSAVRTSKIEANTLEGKIDLKAIKDMRRALRRKYASRSNVHKIFNQWDRKKQGALDPKDVYMGLNKMGIKCTLEQAIALHHSAI